MTSPCEVLIEQVDEDRALKARQIAINEVRRLEAKYSRYRTDSVATSINNRAGDWQPIDSETALLLIFADSAFQLSDGLFDISSGILRRAWRFDGSDHLPCDETVQALLPFVGWQMVQRREQNGEHYLKLPDGMELDFGGFVKEYAADRALLLMTQALPQQVPCLVNLGGDIATNGAAIKAMVEATNGEANTTHEWTIGIESLQLNHTATTLLKLQSGALATSGDIRKFLQKDGVRYGHILNPKTGWPVLGGPATVTVAANSCLEAGLLSTVAMLMGSEAAAFLQQQNRQFWLSE